MHLQGCLSLNQVDLLFSANHVPDKMEPAQRHALWFSGLQDPRIAIYAWPADGIRTPDARLMFCRTQAAQLRKGAGKMAGTTGLAPARISAVTGRHLGYFGLVPVKIQTFSKSWHPRQEFHLHLRRSKRRALYFKLRGHSKWCGRLVLPQRPLQRE